MLAPDPPTQPKGKDHKDGDEEAQPAAEEKEGSRAKPEADDNTPEDSTDSFRTHELAILLPHHLEDNLPVARAIIEIDQHQGRTFPKKWVAARA